MGSVRVAPGASVRHRIASILRTARGALRPDRMRPSVDAQVASYIRDLDGTLSALCGRRIDVRIVRAAPPPTGGRDRKFQSAWTATFADDDAGATCAVAIGFARRRLWIDDRAFRDTDMDQILEHLTRTVAVALFGDRMDDLRRSFGTGSR